MGKAWSGKIAAVRGELWALGAVLGYAAGNLFGRSAMVGGDPLAGPLLRELPSLLLGAFLVLKAGTHWQLQPSHPRYAGSVPLALFAAAGIISLIGAFAFFYALQMGGVNVTVPVLQTQIVWGSLIAWLILKERVGGLVGIGGIALAVGGLIILSIGQMQGIPVSENWAWGILPAALAAAAWGFSGVIWRYGQQQGVERATGIFVHYGTAVLAGLLFLALSGNLGVYKGLAPGDLTALLLSGLFAGVIAVYCLFTALRLISAARVFMVSGLTPLVTAAVAAVWLQEYANPMMVLGMVLTSAGVILFQLYAPKTG